MLLGSYSRLLVLAFTLPEMSHALGLGNIRVESRLNEPLSAQIDIIGATPDELKAMSASVASPELFQRYGAERLAFLSSSLITVGSDAKGKPVLNIKSSQAFTEPLVEFLIDVRFGKAELVRDYSLLLDPARAPASWAQAAPVPTDPPLPLAQAAALEIPNIVLASVPTLASAPAPAKIVRASHPAADAIEMQHRVVPHDTLRNIARQAGARSEAAAQRMMIAIFQANPAAFAGNINRMYSGALIRIPALAEIQVFNTVDVEREMRAQMAAWHPEARPASRRSVAAPAPRASRLLAARSPASADRQLLTVSSATSPLEAQVQGLQHDLDETNRQLAIAAARVEAIEQRAAHNAAPAKAKLPLAPRAPQIKPAAFSAFGALGCVLALLGGGLVYAWRHFMSARLAPRGSDDPQAPTIEAHLIELTEQRAASAAAQAEEAYTVSESGRDPGRSEAPDEDAMLETAQVTHGSIDTVKLRIPGTEDASAMLVMHTLEPSGAQGSNAKLDYNLSDLDGRGQHVEMPTALHDHVVVVERRKNVVDTLMAAIQRDPTRSDLRMKLLETLYSAAATNLRAFKQVVREVANHPERVNRDEWEQIMAMGRQIAADDALFAEAAADPEIADCA